MAKQTTKKENLSEKILEVEMIIPEEVLKKESHFKDVYNNGVLKYNFGDNLPKNVKVEIKEILLKSTVNEIVSFNPLLLELEKLQGFKELKWNEEEKNERDYIDSNKEIGSFNTSIKKVTDVMKVDASAYVKKVNSIRDFFLTEAKTTRAALEENFKPYLDERERKKKEAEDKKNAAVLKANADLVAANKEQAEKLLASKKNATKLAAEGDIGKITFSVASGVSVLNLEGLEDLKANIEKTTFESILIPETITELEFTQEEINEIKVLFETSIRTSIKTIDMAIANIKITEENKTLTAQTPNAILNDNDLPFGPPNSSMGLENDSKGISDKEKIEDIVYKLKILDDVVSSTIDEVFKIDFEDENLQKIQKIILNNSIPQIKEWSTKLHKWADDKKNLYINHITQLNQ